VIKTRLGLPYCIEMHPHLFNSGSPQDILCNFIDSYETDQQVEIIADAAFASIKVFERLSERKWFGSMSCSGKVEPTVWNINKRNIGENEFRYIYRPDLKLVASCCGFLEDDKEEDGVQKFKYHKLFTNSYTPTQIYDPISNLIFNTNGKKFVSENGSIIQDGKETQTNENSSNTEINNNNNNHNNSENSQGSPNDIPEVATNTPPNNSNTETKNASSSSNNNNNNTQTPSNNIAINNNENTSSSSNNNTQVAAIPIPNNSNIETTNDSSSSNSNNSQTPNNNHENDNITSKSKKSLKLGFLKSSVVIPQNISEWIADFTLEELKNLCKPKKIPYSGIIKDKLVARILEKLKPTTIATSFENPESQTQSDTNTLSLPVSEIPSINSAKEKIINYLKHFVGIPIKLKPLLQQLSITQLKDVCKERKISCTKLNKDQIIEKINMLLDPTTQQQEKMKTYKQIEQSNLILKKNKEQGSHHQFYKDNFNGVDLLDRIYYTTEPQFKTKEWKCKMLLSIMETVLINACTLLCEFKGEKINYLVFRKELIIKGLHIEDKTAFLNQQIPLQQKKSANTPNSNEEQHENGNPISSSSEKVDEKGQKQNL